MRKYAISVEHPSLRGRPLSLLPSLALGINQTHIYVLCFFRVGVYTTATAEHIAAGLDAKGWCEFCIAAVGAGKGGGRDIQSTANIPVDGTGKSADEVLAMVVDAAKTFAAQKGL